MMESREKRRVEKPQIPRSAKRVSRKQMEGELEDLGIDMDETEQVGHFEKLSSNHSFGFILKLQSIVVLTLFINVGNIYCFWWGSAYIDM